MRLGQGAIVVPCTGLVNILLNSERRPCSTRSSCVDNTHAELTCCSVEACNSARWQYGPYGSCSAQCGGGTASRGAICGAGNPLGAPDAPSACNATLQLAPLQRPCNPVACDLHVWTVGSWGLCDAPCGGGTHFLTSCRLCPCRGCPKCHDHGSSQIWADVYYWLGQSCL